MTRVRVLLHALDRTGPPMLALALLRWIVANVPDWQVEVLSFRGGPLERELAGLVPVQVLLGHQEPWDHESPPEHRVHELRAALADGEPVDLTLLVSVAAGQCLTLLPPSGTPVVTWVVEQGEDLHWLGPPVDVAARTDRWLAGSRGTADELARRLPTPAPVEVAPEFIELRPVDRATVAACRRQLLGASDGRLVVAAGIGTWRKAPDLFIEVALAHRRMFGPGTRFVWIGGERDPLVPLAQSMTSELGEADLIGWESNTADLAEHIAAADVLVHPARLDAFPLVCLHAAAGGTPVAAFEGVGGVPEMMGDHFVGAPYPDIDGLASSVELLLEPVTGRRAAASQQAHVRARYVAEVAAQRLIDVLRASTHIRAGAKD